MSTPSLTTRNNPDITEKIANPQKMYAKNASALPGQSPSGDEMSTSEYMDAVDRRNGKSRLFAVQTPGEKIQQAQGPEGVKSQTQNRQSILGGQQ